jgi:hypothetical protein
MISVVCLENFVVDQRVRFKRITEFAERLVHDETVQRPFKKRTKCNASNETNACPEKEYDHGLISTPDFRENITILMAGIKN